MPTGRITAVRITAVTVAAVAALGFTAPTALAGVDPDPVGPGQQLRLSDDRKCDMSMGARAFSPLFGETALSAGADRMVAAVTTASTARPGRYPVTIRCGAGGVRVTGAVSVLAAPSRGAEAGTGASGGGAAQLACGTALLALAVSGAVRRRRRCHR